MKRGCPGVSVEVVVLYDFEEGRMRDGDGGWLRCM